MGCGFIKPPGSETEWQICMHGDFEINREVLGIKTTRQSCHHEVWIHCTPMRGKSSVTVKTVQPWKDRSGVHTPKKAKPMRPSMIIHDDNSFSFVGKFGWTLIKALAR